VRKVSIKQCCPTHRPHEAHLLTSSGLPRLAKCLQSVKNGAKDKVACLGLTFGDSLSTKIRFFKVVKCMVPYPQIQFIMFKKF